MGQCKVQIFSKILSENEWQKTGGAPLRNTHFLVFVLLFLRATETSDLKVEDSGYISTGGHTSQLITRQNIYQNGPYTGVLAAIP